MSSAVCGLSCKHYTANVADIKKTMLMSFDVIQCDLKVDNRYTVDLIGDLLKQKEILRSIWREPDHTIS